MLALFTNAEVTMFKFIHAADVHLDSPLRGLSRYESAPAESIRYACRRAFENLVDLAIEEKVAFVLLAGDLYDGDWKDYNTGIFLSQQMGRLGQHNILVFTVAGNHDAANRMTKALDSPTNMSILSSRKVETIKLDDLSVAIHGRSFGTQHVDENLAAGFPAAQKGVFNIGLLHTSLDGREGHAVYAPCSIDDLHRRRGGRPAHRHRDGSPGLSLRPVPAGHRPGRRNQPDLRTSAAVARRRAAFGDRGEARHPGPHRPPGHAGVHRPAGGQAPAGDRAAGPAD